MLKTSVLRNKCWFLSKLYFQKHLNTNNMKNWYRWSHNNIYSYWLIKELCIHSLVKLEAMMTGWLWRQNQLLLRIRWRLLVCQQFVMPISMDPFRICISAERASNHGTRCLRLLVPLPLCFLMNWATLNLNP